MTDLFSITCTTCKSRLRVRDQAAIGQILACPKCGGMVMIKPPPNWSDGGAESGSELPTATEVISASSKPNQTVSGSAFDAVDDLLSDAPPRVTPATFDAPPVSTGPRPRFIGGPPAPPPLPPELASASEAQETKTVVMLQSATPGKTPAQAPPPPAEIDFTPLSEQAGGLTWRNGMLMAGSVVGGVLLAFAAVTVAIHLFLKGPAVVKRGPSNSTLAENIAPQGDSVINSAPIIAAAPEPETKLPAMTAAPPTHPGTPLAESSPPTQSAKAAPATAESDPLGLVKETPPSAAPMPSTDSLAKFDRLLASDAADPLAKSPEQPPPSTTAIAAPEATPARPLAPRPPPREIDIAKRLADPLSGIESSGTPLADFLQVISDYSTIPISLEPDAMVLVRVTPETPVVVNAANTNVGGALADALRPLKLESIVIDDQIVVRLVEPNPMATIEVQARELTDGSEQQLTKLAEMLQSLIEPNSWAEGAESGSVEIDPAKNALRVRNRRTVQAQVLLTCDKLRVARGKPPVLKLDASAFEIISRSSKAQKALQTPISLNFRQPTRLLTILERLSESAGMRLLVDWRDVAAAGWNPAGEATLVADQQPLTDALDFLLNPLDLTWRVVDGRTIQVVTPARLANQFEIEFYKTEGLIADDPAGESLLASIRDALGEATFRDAGGNGEIRFDTDGRCLIAALPQAKQRELELLLSKTRPVAAKN